MSLTGLQTLLEDDLKAVQQVIADQLSSDVDFIEEVSEYIVQGGGKRLRPMVTLLGGKVFGYQGDDLIKLAAAIEFFHTATLMHDDVVDNSELRRGRTAVHEIWGNKASVLIGDSIFTCSIQLLVAANSLKVLDVFAKASNLITKGEVLQLINCHKPDTNEDKYREVIQNKTATLFAATSQFGAILAARSEAEQQAMADFGLHLGMAFQLVDDALDYCGDEDAIGKNLGDDLAEGKPTLPIIHALQNGTAEQQHLIRHALESCSDDNLETIVAAISDNGSIDYTYRAARQEMDLAITALSIIPDSPYKTALINLAHFAVDRQQ